MDIIKLAKESGITLSKSRHFMRDGVKYSVYESSENAILNFAQKIRDARDAEWMAEPFGYREYTPDSLACYFTYTADTARNQEPLFAKPKEVKTAHEQPYWLCCGSTDYPHPNNGCLEAKAGHPERVRFGTKTEHSNQRK